MNKLNRRAFLHHALHATAATGVLTSMPSLLRTAQANEVVNGVIHGRNSGTGYRALVCIDLKGGNDGFNMIIPMGSGDSARTSYNAYAKARGGVYASQENGAAGNESGLALDGSNILPLTSTDGSELGIHPNMPNVQQLFNAKKAAVVANVGALVRPTSKADYQGKIDLPAHLFSHSDQQILWVSSRADSPDRKGWAGLVSDQFNANPKAVLPMNVSTGGENELQVGEKSFPFFISTRGAIGLDYVPNVNDKCKRNLGQCGTYVAQIRDTSYIHPLKQAYQETYVRSIARNNAVKAALDSSEAQLNDTAYAPFWDAYGVAKDKQTKSKLAQLPKIAQELFMIARIIRLQSVLQMEKQTFYAKMGGYDAHDALLAGQETLLAELDTAIGAFQATIAGFGMSEQVTTFTSSEFGRTTSGNGDGTDHGWGSHHLVIGGSVDGGKLHGKLPNLSPESDNPDNALWGQIIPSVSADQYAATLCSWFGLPDATRDNIFTNLQFMTDASKLAITGPNLGFMKG